ncbi:MAG TPA: alpha/beta hydrolase [Burkholderiales bacterium]|nr:alpha/beta hydrolase [Burkholderiales bacterium]
MNLYGGMDQAALDAAYNNAAAVPQSGQFLVDWLARSDRFTAECERKYLDMRYGDAERNRIDFFPAVAAGPLLVFLHGGYWQLREKERFRFLASGPLAHGIGVAFVGYTLAPEKRLDGIVAEVRAAISWIAAHADEYGADPQQIYVSGWSAGGHLTAMNMTEPSVKGGLAVSGIFDLEPIRLSYLNEKLGLDAAEARRNSPLLNLPAKSAPLTIAYGTAELLELQRQSEDLANAWSRAGLPGRRLSLAGHNHFTILEELASPTGVLTRALRQLCGRGETKTGLAAVSHET